MMSNVILTEAIAQWKDLYQISVHRYFSYPDPSASPRCAQDDIVKNSEKLC